VLIKLANALTNRTNRDLNGFHDFPYGCFGRLPYVKQYDILIVYQLDCTGRSEFGKVLRGVPEFIEKNGNKQGDKTANQQGMIC
jgi:hypothetical protein